MLGKFFAITLNYKDGPRTEAIQKALSGYDWLRFSSNTYYVYSFSHDAKVLYDLIRPLLGKTDDILVVELSIANRQGWASKIAVDWLQKARA
ncbi:hypothetical protein [Sphingosinicella sp.]|uniref:hypothetical protein n=1 Tax=Sphingosinicella sp. TaxID=1917971 RepID=UPI0035B05A06